MLAAISPAQFAEWEAEHNIMPWGDDWEQISKLGAWLINALRDREGLKPSDLLRDDALIPSRTDHEETTQPSSLQMMRGRIGV